MSNVGKELKNEREAKGKTRADVARDTGILIHHIAALEYGNLDDLPDDETVAGFVKTYAEYLGFLPDEPVAEFWAERGKEPPAGELAPAAEEVPADGPVVAQEPASPQTAPPKLPVRSATTAPVAVASAPAPAARRPLWHWIAVGAAVVIILIWFRTRGEPEIEPVAPEPEATPIVEAASKAESAPPVPEPVQEQTVAVEPAVETAAPAPNLPAPTLSITEHGVGTGVENRRLVGESDRFRLGTRVWFWTRVVGGGAGDEVRHVWIRDGRDFSTVMLRIGSANWRTQSAKTLYDKSEGRWAVEARDAAGNVLARSEFTCER